MLTSGSLFCFHCSPAKGSIANIIHYERWFSTRGRTSPHPSSRLLLEQGSPKAQGSAWSPPHSGLSLGRSCQGAPLHNVTSLIPRWMHLPFCPDVNRDRHLGATPPFLAVLRLAWEKDSKTIIFPWGTCFFWNFEHCRHCVPLSLNKYSAGNGGRSPEWTFTYFLLKDCSEVF